jgi:ABC-type branched-subunit amino acid transport system substrate-binding protein
VNGGAGAAQALGEGGASPSAAANGGNPSGASVTGAGATLAGGAAGSATSGLIATDRGVTATTIKVGVLILDLGGAGKYGFNIPGFSTEQQRAAWTAYINELNTNGGIKGRRVVPVFQNFDITNRDSMRAACLALTQDARVFIVFEASAFDGPAVLCITEENRTPMFMVGSLGTPEEWYQRSRGYLFTMFQSGDRTMRNFAWEFDQMGELKGKRIGILGGDDPGHHAQIDVLQKSLEDLGHRVVHRSNLSYDLGTGSSQIPLEVQQMRSAGVNAIMLAANTVYTAQFVRAADAQGYTPRYYMSDWQSLSNAQGLPDSFDGSLAVTSSNQGDRDRKIPGYEQPYDASCAARMVRATGKQYDDTGVPYNNDIRTCTLLDLFTAAARSLDPNGLTRDAFSAAMQRLGKVQMAAFPPEASFSPGKFSGADYVRIQRYEKSRPCFGGTRGCMYPITGFHKSRY